MPVAKTTTPPAASDAPDTSSPWGRAPSLKLPAVPPHATPSSLRAYMGYRPTRTEVSLARGAIQDLAAFTDYVSLLGHYAPAPSAVAEALRVALAWRALRKPLEALLAYARFGDADAWKTALTLVEEMKPSLVNAIAKRGALATDYPSLAAFVGAAKETARRANATKKKKAKQKADADQKASVAAAKAAAKANAETQATRAKKGVTISI